MTSIEQAAEYIKEADALIISASNGLSIQEGFNIFASDRKFADLLGDLAINYNVHNFLEALSISRVSASVRWTIYARIIDQFVNKYQGSQAMADLLTIAQELPHFVITSNGEGHFQRAGFDENRVFQIEGCFADAQCPSRCQNRIFDAGELVKSMNGAQYDGVIADALVPACPDCERPLVLRAVTTPYFLQDESIADNFNNFLAESANKRVCVLELGVGWRNQMLKAPLMNYVEQTPNARYVTVNLGEVYIPDAIKSRSVGINATCGEALSNLREALGLKPSSKDDDSSKLALSPDEASIACSEDRNEEMDPLTKDALRLLELMEEADAILVGAASGLSAAAGYRHYYERDAEFVEWFGDFEEKYGVHSSFDAAYYHYSSPEERCAFMARMVTCVLSEPTGQPYLDLKELLEGKNFHLLTTNQDTQFNHLYPEELISAIQGDWRFMQCSRPCHDQVYPAEEVMRELNSRIDENLRLQPGDLARCPKCNALMEPWVRGPQFLEGSRYRAEYAKVEKFLSRYEGKKILFLELGVGRMTPMFIQEPFWNMTYSMPNSFYCTINPKDARIHPAIAKRSYAIRDDIAAVFSRAVELKRTQAQE